MPLPLRPPTSKKTPNLQFIDEVRIFVAAGDGGNGCVSFRREKFVPRGGPDGGDGGHGGGVVLEVRQGLYTLLDFKYRPHLRARRGAHGQGSEKAGRGGQDVVFPVPPGTLVFVTDDETEELLADLTEPGRRFVVARGGRGGRGNMRFATSTNRAPRRADPGEPGQQRWLRLELRLLADVGLVGLPNVGKSTIISAITRATPKIGNYPFTTLAPNLGVVKSDIYEPFVVADLPGLIEGASQGAGLGIRFLRHVKRTALLVHVLDASRFDVADPLRDVATINQEIETFDRQLASKPRVVFLNKTDLAPEKAAPALALLKGAGFEALAGSGLTGDGLAALMEWLAARLEGLRGKGAGHEAD
ncbi:MAG: GTPase ObgE [Pseudomonadota bacterium]